MAGGCVPAHLFLSSFIVDKDVPLSMAFSLPPSCALFAIPPRSPSDQPLLGMEGSVEVNDWTLELNRAGVNLRCPSSWFSDQPPLL